MAPIGAQPVTRPGREAGLGRPRGADRSGPAARSGREQPQPSRCQPAQLDFFLNKNIYLILAVLIIGRS